jgi:sugar lactone lactonase YvrE
MALGLPSQVAVDAQHRVHLYQRNGPPVLVFDPNGRFVGSYGEGIADPHGIYCSPDDRIFLVDRDAHQVIITSADGEEQGRLGERHRAHWQEPFNHPTDAAVGPDGRIFVADGYGNARVHRFSAAGAHELVANLFGRKVRFVRFFLFKTPLSNSRIDEPEDP